MNKVLTDSPTPDQTEIEKIIRGLGENPALKSEAHEEVIQEALAAISKLMVLERIDELQNVRAAWYLERQGSQGHVDGYLKERLLTLKKGI